MVSVKRADGLRLATLVPGMAFGEMALVETHRTADVWADTAVQCVELPLDSFHAFREQHPRGRRAHHAQSREPAVAPAWPRQYAHHDAGCALIA